jgi:repressor LexA
MSCVANDQRPAWAKAFYERRKRLNLTQQELSDRTYDPASDKNIIAQTTVSDLERGIIHPMSLQGNRLLAIYRALEFDPASWAALGLGQPSQVMEQRVEDAVSRAGPDLRLVSLPIIEAGAGPPWFQDDPEMITLLLPDLNHMDPENTFCVRVRGNSMQDYVSDGSLVICRRQDHAEPGQVVAVWMSDDGVVIKRYLSGDNDTRLTLGNDNSNYVPVLVAPPGSRIVGVSVMRIQKG